MQGSKEVVPYTSSSQSAMWPQAWILWPKMMITIHLGQSTHSQSPKVKWTELLMGLESACSPPKLAQTPHEFASLFFFLLYFFFAHLNLIPN